MIRSNAMIVAALLAVVAVARASPFMELVDLSKLEESTIEYSGGVNRFEGHFVYDKTVEGKRPVVVVIPNQRGLDDFDVWITRRLAHAGYAGYAIDLYGTDIPREGIASIPEERQESLRKNLEENPEEWQQRCEAGLLSVNDLNDEIVDTTKIIVVGYSFGGLSALEMVRKGVKNVSGIVAIHPTTLKPVGGFEGDKFEGRLAVFLGDRQSGISRAEIFEFQTEMKEAGVTFEVTRIGKADDEYLVPTHDKLNLEPLEKQLASERTWLSLLGFLDDVSNPENVDYLDDAFQTTNIDESKLNTGRISYKEGQTELSGFYAYDESVEGQRPVVVVVPDWDGIGEYEIWRAKLLAHMGYVGFVADMYGTAIEQGPALPFPVRIQQITTLNAEGGKGVVARQLAALDGVKAAEELSGVADTTSIVAIGYCFGGSAVLDLLRAKPDCLKGVVAYHAGNLEAAGQKAAFCNNIPALIHNGDDDPAILDEEIDDALTEFNDAKVNWEFVDYGDTLHSFTNPESPRKAEEGGSAEYSPIADIRSWHSTETFLKEVFSETSLYQACPVE